MGASATGSGALDGAAFRAVCSHAGVTWVDAPLVVDGNLVSSRTPADLPVFARGMVDWLHSH